MRAKWFLLPLAIVAACTACSKDGGKKTEIPDAWIEVQVAVRRLPAADKPKRKAQRQVLRSFAVPVPAKGKAGRAVATVEGARLDLSWAATDHLPDYAEGIDFEGLAWRIPNQIVIDDKAPPVTLSAEPKAQILRSDFVLLAEPVRIAPAKGGNGEETEISVRARWLGAGPEVKDLRIGSRKEPEEPVRPRKLVVGPF